MDEIEEFELSLSDVCYSCKGFRSHKPYLKRKHYWCNSCGGSGLERTYLSNFFGYPSVIESKKPPYLRQEYWEKRGRARYGSK